MTTATAPPSLPACSQPSDGVQEGSEDLAVAEILRRVGLAVTSELDLDRLVQRLTDEATSLLGAQFGAFFYNVRNDGERYMLYALSGAPREAFDHFGMPRNTKLFAPTFAGEGVVRADDIIADPRYGQNTPFRGMPEGHLPVRSYLAVPVRSPSGVVHGGFFFGHSAVGVFGSRAERLAVGIAAQAAISIDNANLFRQLRTASEAQEARAKHLALLADVAIAFAKEFDFPAALRQTTDAVVKHLDAAFARIWTVDASKTTLELRASSGMYTHLDGAHARVPIGAFKIGKIAAERAPHLTNDVLNDPRVGDREWARREGMVAFAGYPLLAGTEVLGVIALFSRATLSSDTLAALASVADVVTVGIDRRRADEAKEKAELRQSALVAAGRALASSLDYDTTLSSIASVCVPSVADWCVIDVIDRAGVVRRTTVVHRDPARAAACEAFKALPPTASDVQPAAAAIRTRAPVLLGDITNVSLDQAMLDGDHRRLLAELGCGSAVAVPLFTEERLIGAVCIFSAAKNRYDEGDVALLEEIARRAALALDNARLYREVELAHQRLASIFEQAPAAIATTIGPDHVLETTNERYRQFSGRRDVRGKPMREAFPERVGEGLFELLDEVYRTGKPFVGNEVPSRIDRHGDGNPEEGYLNFVYQPLIDATGVTGIMTLAYEVTEMVEARRRVEQLVRALQQSNQDLDQFAYVASHDLKAPLRGIANLSAWIEEDLGANASPETRKHLDLMRGRVHRLEALIDGILSYSRAGRVREAAERIDVRALLDETLELLQPPPDARIEIGDGMPIVLAERVPFQQVFQNLIGNCLKHARRKDVLVRIGCTDAGDAWDFYVSDNGQGIAPEFHGRIWGIFQTLEARDRIEGTGIGLSIVKKVVEARGGRVSMESAVGQGATFHVRWPKRLERVPQ